MASQRLTFLYPQVLKSATARDASSWLLSSPARRRRKPNISDFSTISRRKQEQIPIRYGTAQEPQLPPLPPPPSNLSKPTDDSSLAEAIETEVKPIPSPPKKKAEDSSKIKEDPSSGTTQAGESDKKLADEIRDGKFSTIDLSTEEPKADFAQPSALQQENSLLVQRAKAQNQRMTQPQPLEKMFEIPTPTADKPDEHRAPHMQAPPYVHHFDTYTLVKDLGKGGFTDDQSVTIMKAVRGLLAVNLDVAKEGLVGKSDVENELYLFRAACSELRTEILNARRTSSATRQTQLHHLQHSADILSQRVSQETLALRDDLRGMLNDRRMASREQSQQRDSEISELNYGISARLNGDSKSEVEGLRWVLTRRAAMAIGGMAIMILASLRYGSYRIHEMEVEAKRTAERKERSLGGGSGGGGGGAGGGSGGGVSEFVGGLGRDMGTQTSGSVGDTSLSNKGESVGLVSLG